MADPTSGVSAGEVGGIVAGSLAVLVAIGHGIKWLLNWGDARAASRSAKLQAWHDEIAAREAALDAKLEERLSTIERQNRALHQAFNHVAAALIRADPQNAALQQADRILALAFPLDFTTAAARAGAALDQGLD